jgi:hypothetical protein
MSGPPERQSPPSNAEPLHADDDAAKTLAVASVDDCQRQTPATRPRCSHHPRGISIMSAAQQSIRARPALVALHWERLLRFRVTQADPTIRG